MDVTDDLRSAFSSVPVNRHLGFRLDARSANEAVVSMEPSPNHLQEGGRLHGGLITAIADTAAVNIFVPDLAEGETLTSIEFKMSFLRPVLPDRGRVVARSRILKRGRRVGFCEVEVSQADQLVAKGSFSYLFFDR